MPPLGSTATKGGGTFSVQFTHHQLWHHRGGEEGGGRIKGSGSGWTSTTEDSISVIAKPLWVMQFCEHSPPPENIRATISDIYFVQFSTSNVILNSSSDKAVTSLPGTSLITSSPAIQLLQGTEQFSGEARGYHFPSFVIQIISDNSLVISDSLPFWQQ